MQGEISRRAALRLGATTGMAAAFPSFSFAQPAARRIPIALELYSVRNELAKDFVPVIEAVGKMGYQGVEFAGYHGWDKKPNELRKLLDENGLKCCGTHTALPTLEGDNLKKTADLDHVLGNKFLICPSLSARSAQGWLDLAHRFNDISDRAREYGMLVGYHSHAGDFRKYDGKTAWEIFFDNTKPQVVHQIDIGNTLDGGGDPIAMIRRYPGRTKTTHIKEHGGPPGAAIGEGTNDWPALFDAYETVGGTEWYIVEHETGSNPLQSVRTCLENLHKMGR